MSNDKREPWRPVSDEVMATYADTAMGTAHAVEMAAEKGYELGRQEAAPATNERDAHEAVGHRKGMEDALDIVDGRGTVDDSKFMAQANALREHITDVRNAAFIAGFSSARDMQAAQADEAESYARGQAAEAEQVQARAAASATRAVVYRNGVALLDREIATLKGEGK